MAARPRVSVSKIPLPTCCISIPVDRVWGGDYYGDTKTLDVHIKRLRAKIEADPANPVLIQTIRGLGYKLENA